MNLNVALGLTLAVSCSHGQHAMLRLGTCLLCVVLGPHCFGQSNDVRAATHADGAQQEVVISPEALIRDLERLQAQDPTNVDALVTTLSELGFAHYSNNEFAAADATLTQAVRLAEQHWGVGDLRLARPLEGLGLVALEREQYALAIDLMQRALMLVQRREGLLYLGQANLLDKLATAQTGARRYEAAEKTLQHLVRVHERAHGRRDARVVPTYTRLAEWYAYMGDLSTARLILRRVLQISETEYGVTSSELIRPLRALSRSYYAELVYGARVSGKFSDRELLRAQSGASSRRPATLPPEALLSARSSASEGERSILRAVMIAESLHEEAGREAVIQTLLEAGDWFAFKKQADKSTHYYQRAWVVANARGQGDSILNFPQPIFFPFIDETAKNAAGAEHHLTVQFAVKRDGTTADIEILDSNASAEEAKAIEKAIRIVRYRPKFVGGEPVETQGMMYRHVFQ